MGDKTNIEWTDATWNPVTGCDRISPGCDNCYALTLAARLKRMGSANYQTDGDPRTSGPGFGVQCHPDMLDQPLRWKKPRRIFVNSMSDLFHRQVPDEFIARVFTTMAEAQQHTFQILTKRPQRIGSFDARVELHLRQTGRKSEATWPLPNVWLGTSIENNQYVFRADHLRNVRAAVRFLSLEPLLGPLPSLDLTGISWVIVGGESGPGARPMHPEWAADLRDRCVAAGVPFHFKQWGEWSPIAPLNGKGQFDFSNRYVLAYDGTLYGPGDLDYPNGPRYGEALRANHRWLTAMYRVGKKAAGRELDGRTWDQFPKAVTA